MTESLRQEQLTPIDNDFDTKICAGLYEGLRNQKDPVTWRTLLVTVGSLLGVDVQWKYVPKEQTARTHALLAGLTEGTPWRPLVPEMMAGLGLISPETPRPLDLLIVSARRFGPDPLFWRLAETAQAAGIYTAAINVVGNYQDAQPRIAGLATLLRPVKKLVFLGSTQAADGGSMTVVENVARLLRNPAFSSRIDEAYVTTPMIGGSRGHRLGQREDLVYEVLEMIVNPKAFGFPAKDVLRELRKEQTLRALVEANPVGMFKALLGQTIPKVKVVTVDIHSPELPARVFEKMGFEFISANPAPEFAASIYGYLEEENLLDKPLVVVACDKGAIERAEGIALQLLNHPKNSLHQVELLYIDKFRKQAGAVEKVTLSRRVQWKKQSDGLIKVTEMMIPSTEAPDDEEYVVILTDDMADSCLTAKKDTTLVRKCFPKAVRSIFAFTHPVLSQGVKPLDDVSVDLFIFGNTLRKGLELTARDDVVMVDLSPSILRAIGF